MTKVERKAAIFWAKRAVTPCKRGSRRFWKKCRRRVTARRAWKCHFHSTIAVNAAIVIAFAGHFHPFFRHFPLESLWIMALVNVVQMVSEKIVITPSEAIKRSLQCVIYRCLQPFFSLSLSLCNTECVGQSHQLFKSISIRNYLWVSPGTRRW